MKHWFSYILTVVLVCTLIALLAWTLEPEFLKNSVQPISPLPSFLTMIHNVEVTTLDVWAPFIQRASGNQPVPQISARSAFLYDLTSNQILFEKSAKQPLPIASLTKIMTAVIALENRKTDDHYVVTNDALVGEDAMGLENGEILSLEELLYGLFLHSGNDAAEVIAHNFSGGRKAFTRAMNKKAEALGLSNTHFTNPTGLQGDGDQYSTAYDLLVISRYALEHFPIVEKISSTPTYTIAQTQTHKEFYLENETNLLSTYEGVKGIKTGYTPEALLCLITYLDYGGHKIIAVLLGSENRRKEMVELLNYSLKTLGITPPPYTGGVF